MSSSLTGPVPDQGLSSAARGDKPPNLRGHGLGYECKAFSLGDLSGLVGLVPGLQEPELKGRLGTTIQPEEWEVLFCPGRLHPVKGDVLKGEGVLVTLEERVDGPHETRFGPVVPGEGGAPGRLAGSAQVGEHIRPAKAVDGLLGDRR